MNPLSAIGRRVRRFLADANAPLRSLHERQLVLQALLVAMEHRRAHTLRTLQCAEFRVFSQWGEDGIIDWLVERLPGIPKSFVEFGVEDYRESNTRLLLMLRNWRGLVMDGSRDHTLDIQNQDIHWRHDLTANCAFIDRENINELLIGAGFAGEIGLLSIDIDGNDYWVWQAISAAAPAIVVCEYNAVLGDLYQLSVPYQPTFQRTQAHASNLYFGASLPALISLGAQKGYTFVGTNSSGANAFFVRNDHAQKIVGALDEIRAFPSRFRESRSLSGELTFIRGNRRAAEIGDLEFVDPSTGRHFRLGELGNLYSAEWREAS